MTFDEWFAINIGPAHWHTSSYEMFKRCWEAAYEEGTVKGWELALEPQG